MFNASHRTVQVLSKHIAVDQLGLPRCFVMRMTWLYSPRDHTILHDSAGNRCRIAACMQPPEQDSTVYAAKANGTQNVACTDSTA